MRRFKSYTLQEYRAWLERQRVTRAINHIQIHHTWKPRKTDYRGEQTIIAMYRYHTGTRGWSDIAQHITVSPDGLIWDGRDLNVQPAGIANRNTGGIMIEIIGNFDRGEETLVGKQLNAVLGVVNLLFDRFTLGPQHLVFHREHADKTCPGTGIDKQIFINQVLEWRKNNNSGGGDDVSEDRSNWPFPDVPNKHYAAQAIQALKELGIVQGKADGNFHPTEPLTRADAAVLIHRLFQHIKGQ